MDPKRTASLDGLHPQMLRAGLRSSAKADRKPLADLRPVVGQLVERALVLAGISKQVAAYEMHYADQGTVSRWCSGLERPAFDKLFALDGFRAAYVLAIAEADEQMDATTVITIRRSA
jgi:hypothetical protein